MNNQIDTVIQTVAGYYGLDLRDAGQADNYKLWISQGACIKIMIHGAHLALFLFDNEMLVSRVNDMVVSITNQTWETELMSKIYLLKTLYENAGVCNKCGKTMTIYRQVDKAKKNYGEYYARCPSKQALSDAHSQFWITIAQKR